MIADEALYTAKASPQPHRLLSRPRRRDALFNKSGATRLMKLQLRYDLSDKKEQHNIDAKKLSGINV
jgi:hypothetical protein